LLLGALGAVPACGLNQEGVAPPRNRISFPGSVKVDPDRRWLYVVNSNADLRFNAGTVVAVDVKLAAEDRYPPADDESRKWKVCEKPDYVRMDASSPRCCWDYLDHNILNCDERTYIHADSTIEVGSFGAGSALQSFKDAPAVCPTIPETPANRRECNPPCDLDGADRSRFYLAVRGNSSLTYFDIARDKDGFPTLTCPVSPASESAQDCAIKDDEMSPFYEAAKKQQGNSGLQPTVVPDEPYALQLDERRDLLYVGHLRGDVTRPSSGGISLFDIANASKGALGKPIFLRPSGPIFPADTTGSYGVSSLTMKGEQLYATSRFTPMATEVIPSIPGAGCTAQEQFNDFAVFPTSNTFVSPLFGAEVRGIQFLPRRQPKGAAPTPERAFLLQRTPPAVLSFDSAMNQEGVYGNFPSEVIEVCQAPTFLQKDRTATEETAGADDALLYVSCFDQGQVYLIDPRVPRLVGIVDVGRGPAGLEFGRPLAGEARRVAYVVLFGSNSIGVLDLTPGNDTQYHIIQRIGFPSVTPRQ
jgi:hypothetical protein